MSLTLLGWLLLVFSVALSTLLILYLRPSGSRSDQLDPERCKARREEIGVQRKVGKPGEAEADAARLALLVRPRPSRWVIGPDLRGIAVTLILPAMVFLLVAGVGAAISYVDAPLGSGDTGSSSVSDPGSDGELLARLTDYAHSVETEDPASAATAGKMLPDVNTMTERLASRLETTPDDIRGWRMLGWSYSQMGRYAQAASAFARAVELDPGSAELKLAYEEAKAKASGAGNPEKATTLQADAIPKVGDGRSVDKSTGPEAMLSREHDAAIRSMVDGLANRLEDSPRDVEGWTHLMRSRVVLGERELAAIAFRKALEVFKDDRAASGRITAAAFELGLNAE